MRTTHAQHAIDGGVGTVGAQLALHPTVSIRYDRRPQCGNCLRVCERTRGDNDAVPSIVPSAVAFAVAVAAAMPVTDTETVTFHCCYLHRRHPTMAGTVRAGRTVLTEITSPACASWGPSGCSCAPPLMSRTGSTRTRSRKYLVSFRRIPKTASNKFRCKCACLRRARPSTIKQKEAAGPFLRLH